MGVDVVVTTEDAVREPLVAQELSKVLDRVELGRAGRQRQEGEVGRHDEVLRDVPAGLVEDQEGGRRARLLR
jgi:hypothetical protein